MATRYLSAVFGMSALLLLLGCAAGSDSTNESDSVEKLAWLDDADAEEVFRSDLRSNRLRFFVVEGYTSEIPGVGRMRHLRCYHRVALTTIEGTSDAIESPEHRRLNQLARDFAATYNGLTRAAIDFWRKDACQE